MTSTLITQRYAKALLEAAVAEEVDELVAGEAHALAEALGDDRDVKRFLSDPLSSSDDKLGVLLSSFPEAPHIIFKQFLRVVLENRRERHLPAMLKEYLRLLRDSHGETKAELTTSFKLSVDQRKLLERELSKRLDRKVELIPMVDRDILGGAKLRVGDQIYDGSLRSRLKRLEIALKAEPKQRRATVLQPKTKAAKKKIAAKKTAPKKTQAKKAK